MTYIILFLALPFIGIWMISSSSKSINRDIEKIRKLNEGKTNKEKINSFGCAIALIIIIIIVCKMVFDQLFRNSSCKKGTVKYLSRSVQWVAHCFLLRFTPFLSDATKHSIYCDKMLRQLNEFFTCEVLVLLRYFNFKIATHL